MRLRWFSFRYLLCQRGAGLLLAAAALAGGTFPTRQLNAQQPNMGQAAPSAVTASPAPGQLPKPGAPAPAQAPATAAPGAGSTPFNTIRTNVRLVILDLVVTDRQGNAVTTLTRDDFYVQEDGVEQTVRNFDPPGKYTPSATGMIHSTADLDQQAPRAPVNIVLLDEFNTRFEDMAFARYSLKKWLERQPDRLDTPTMLVAVSLQKFDVLHDYSQNKGEILSALDHHFAAYPWQAQQFAWVAERYSTAFFTLRRVAEATTGHPGHKNMIWIGRGFPNINLQRFAVDDQTRVGTAVQQTVNELRDARVTLYTIDPAGLQVNPGSYGEDAALFDPFGGEPNFQKLATATGGRNLYGRNNVDAEIGTAIHDGASFYTLAYRPTNEVRDINKFRKIKVTVANRPDLTVVTRQGYFDDRRPARLTADNQLNRKLASELVGAETSTMVYDGVPVTLAITSTPGKYNLHLPGRGLVWTEATDTEPRKAKLILMVTTFDKKGKVLKTDTRAIVVKATGQVSPTGRLDRAISIEYQVPPDPKAVRARFVVRVDATGRMGTADADLTQPPPQTAVTPVTMPSSSPQ